MTLTALERSRQSLLAVVGQYDPSGRWHRFWRTAFDLASEPLSRDEDQALQERQLKTVEVMSDIAPLMGQAGEEVQARLADGIREIERHTRLTPFVNIPYEQTGEEPTDPSAPLSIMKHLNAPFVQDQGDAISFYLPCCMSSNELLVLPQCSAGACDIPTCSRDIERRLVRDRGVCGTRVQSAAWRGVA